MKRTANGPFRTPHVLVEGVPPNLTFNLFSTSCRNSSHNNFSAFLPTKKIEKRLFFVCFQDKQGLANPTSSGKNRELGTLLGIIPDFTQGCNFLFSVKEFHLFYAI